jgi:hypothetical protein
VHNKKAMGIKYLYFIFIFFFVCLVFKSVCDESLGLFDIAFVWGNIIYEVKNLNDGEHKCKNGNGIQAVELQKIHSC